MRSSESNGVWDLAAQRLARLRFGLQVAVDIAHHKTMYDLHQRVAPGETIVGW